MNRPLSPGEFLSHWRVFPDCAGGRGWFVCVWTVFWIDCTLWCRHRLQTVILLNPSLGFISVIGSEKGHSADAPLFTPPPHMNPPPFPSSSPPSPSTHPPPLSSRRLKQIWDENGVKWSSQAAGETQGESDITLLTHHPGRRSPPHPPACSHLAWRRWDARATNHLYTLISVSGPWCYLLLRTDDFQKEKPEGEMGRKEGEVWQFPRVWGHLRELDLRLGGK